MRRAGAPVSGRLRSPGRRPPSKANKRLIATLPSSEFGLTGCKQRHIAKSNSDSKPRFGNQRPPSLSSGGTPIKRRDAGRMPALRKATAGHGQDPRKMPALRKGTATAGRPRYEERERQARKNLVATFPRVGFELTSCKHARSHFSSSNKNGISGNCSLPSAATPTVQNLWKLKSGRPQQLLPAGLVHPIAVYGAYLGGTVKLFTRNRHRSFGGIKRPGRCIIPGRFLRRSQ